jgi:hypothetical protein
VMRRRPDDRLSAAQGELYEVKIHVVVQNANGDKRKSETPLSSLNNSGVARTPRSQCRYLPKAASSICASLTPAFCNCSLTTGVFTAT